ncbi:MAG: B12-binding domain-containing radical SAM protein [Candidatus Muiribacteriaceae bacterium]
MKITFVYGGFESLGVEYISAVLKKNNIKTSLVYSPKLFNDTMSEIPVLAKRFEHIDDIVRRIEAEKADLVAFSVVTDDYMWCCRIAEKLKKRCPKIPVVFGGIHPTSVPEVVIERPFVDYICIGEGEYAMLDLVIAIRDKKPDSSIRNIWKKEDGKIIRNPVRPLIPDLDELPFPDKELFYRKAPYNEEHYTTMATRGCFLSCPFCHHNVQKKVYRDYRYGVRARSPEDIIEELIQAKKKYRFRHVLFEDDLFLHNKEWVLRLCSLMIEKKLDIKWFCVAHAFNIDYEVAKAISRAGCKYVEIGIQTLNSETRRNSLKRPEKTFHIKRALNALNKYGVGFNCDHIAGVFGDDEKALIKAAEYYNSVRPNRIYLLFLTLYPETDIAYQALKMGYATQDDIDDKIYGRGGTTTHTGSVNDPVFEEYRFLFGWLPLLPQSVNRFIIRHRLYKYLPRPVFIASVIPEALTSIFGNIFDFRGQIIIKKYLHHILRGGF